MPRAILNAHGKHQSRTLLLALRRIAKDPDATVAERLRACELLAMVEGFNTRLNRTKSGTRGSVNKTQNAVRPISTSPENVNRMRELLEMSRVAS
jgi:hypothetical protein